jgi:hypothetical protein
MIHTEAMSVSVNSTLLTGVAFHTGESILDLEFRNGACYRYYEVPVAIYEGLLAADSKGAYFNRQIRTCFRYTVISRPR